MIKHFIDLCLTVFVIMVWISWSYYQTLVLQLPKYILRVYYKKNTQLVIYLFTLKFSPHLFPLIFLKNL
jgi:hypothetical protein